MPLSADNPMAPRPPHFAPKAKRVIYLHMSGGPPQQDLFDFKPELVKHHMQPCPDELLKNQKFAFIKGHPKLLGTPYKFQKCGQSGAVLSELWPRSPRRRRRGRHHQVDVYRPVQSCTGGAVPLHGLVAQRRGGDGLVDHLRAGLGEPGPARLRRLDQRRDRPDRRQGPLEHRLPAQRLSRRAVPDRGRSDPLRQRPQGDGPRRPPPHPRRAAAAQRVRARRVRRSRDPDANQPVRAGLPHADGRSRRDGHPPGAGTDPGTVWGQAGRGVVRQQLPAGPPAGRAGRALRPALRLGLGLPRHRRRRRHRQAPAREVQGGRPADRGLARRPQAARAAGGNAGRSGAASSAAPR